MYQGLRLAVVVPAFNEGHKLAAVLAGLPAYLDHVLVVDDGSADGTAAVALAASRPGLELLRHDRNRGVGAAVATGYRRALALGCDATLVMAGDGQMDPRDVPRLLAPIVEGRADYVKGNRFACREVWRAMPATRPASSRSRSRMAAAIPAASARSKACAGLTSAAASTTPMLTDMLID